ncbi:MAG: pyrroline-5-carboxylate reductase [Bifidobacteriaceae bacterium]|jgi:pyrroline-5-carboxylate reductase|nr:pyrroline-5-carboxylate reductase [Bifidobacteriaceae bacterium]
MRIGFIGAGNMAGSIIKGIVDSGLVSGQQIVAHDPHADKLAELAKATGITAEIGNEEVVAAADMVVLAVKPQVFPQVMEQLAGRIVAKRPLVVSIAAGITLAHLDGWLGPDVPVVRVMPNVNVAVGAGMSAVAGNSVASDEQIEQVRELFAAVGHAMVLEERLFPAFTAVAGSSPAWVFLFIDALARGALAAGMTKQQATEAACQAVLGSAKLLAADSGRHAWQLIDQVSSPGGTTVAGLHTLEDRGFGAAVVAAVAATIKREAELAQSAT